MLRFESGVYLAPANLRGAQKVSLHASGRWRIAFNRADHPLVPAGRDRAFVKWMRPQPQDHPDWTRALEIIIPESELTPSHDASSSDVIWIDPPPIDHAVFLTILFSSAAHDRRDDWIGKQSMGTQARVVVQLASGETVWLLSHIDDVAAPGQELERRRQQIEQSLNAAPASVDLSKGDLRAVLYATRDSDGVHALVDMALKQPRPDAPDAAAP